MYEELQKLKRQVEELQKQVSNLNQAQNSPLKGSLDDIQTERVLNTITTGTPSTNTLLREVAVSVAVPYSIALSGDPQTITGTLTGTGTITVLDYPERLKIDTWKGQRLVIPVYDADKIIYP
jgi:hypothetical protein